MGLREEQSRFVRMVALLVLYAYERGYELTFGDAWARDGHIEGRYHYKRLAVDLNLFRGGEYLTRTEDHHELGRFWERLGGHLGRKVGGRKPLQSGRKNRGPGEGGVIECA